MKNRKTEEELAYFTGMCEKKILMPFSQVINCFLTSVIKNSLDSMVQPNREMFYTYRLLQRITYHGNAGLMFTNERLQPKPMENYCSKIDVSLCTCTSIIVDNLQKIEIIESDRDTRIRFFVIYFNINSKR